MLIFNLVKHKLQQICIILHTQWNIKNIHCVSFVYNLLILMHIIVDNFKLQFIYNYTY